MKQEVSSLEKKTLHSVDLRAHEEALKEVQDDESADCDETIKKCRILATYGLKNKIELEKQHEKTLATQARLD